MRRVLLIVGVVVLALVIGGGVFAWRWSQRGPGHPSVSRAIDRFRTLPTAAPVAHTFQPKAGVYVYTGSGSETLSFLNTRQSQGPTEPGTISLLTNGCWTFEINFNSYHSQSWTRCATNGKLVERGGTADQKFDFVAFKESEHSVTTCNPPIVLIDPGARVGTAWPVHCTGHSKTTNTNMTQTGTMTFVGRETLDIGGKPVAAVHDHQSVTLSGGQTGSVSLDIWFAANDGLPLRESHSITAVSPAPAPINHVTYVERGQWQLTSLTPQR